MQNSLRNLFITSPLSLPVLTCDVSGLMFQQLHLAFSASLAHYIVGQSCWWMRPIHPFRKLCKNDPKGIPIATNLSLPSYPLSHIRQVSLFLFGLFNTSPTSLPLSLSYSQYTNHAIHHHHHPSPSLRPRHLALFNSGLMPPHQRRHLDFLRLA